MILARKAPHPDKPSVGVPPYRLSQTLVPIIAGSGCTGSPGEGLARVSDSQSVRRVDDRLQVAAAFRESIGAAPRRCPRGAAS